MKHRVIAPMAVVALAAVAFGGWAVFAPESDGASADDNGTDAPATSTAQVVRQDLVAREELDGTLGYGDTREVSVGGQGTITALPALGSIVDRGGTLVEVDGRAVPLFLGERPLWRPLGPDSEDGPDIAQLEENLVASGFADAEDVGPDDNWTSATTSAVKDWQEARGVDETGTVSPSDVVFLPTPVRVAEHLASPGSQAGGPAVAVTTTDRPVVVDLAADDQGLLAPGQAVEVELPDGTVVPAHVAAVGTVVEQAPPEQGGGATIEVTVTLDDPAAAGALDEAPVTVRIVQTIADDALTVPVEALLALAEGGYAVERVTGATTQLVAVEPGEFADGFVEIVGDIAEGDEVVVPA